MKVTETSKNVSVSKTLMQNSYGCVTRKGPAIGEIQVEAVTSSLLSLAQNSTYKDDFQMPRLFPFSPASY